MHDDLEKSLLRAESLRERVERGMKALPGQHLHQMILGPRKSGKSTQAYEYIEALKDKGFIADTQPVLVNCGQRPGAQTILDAIAKLAPGKAVLVDDPDRLHGMPQWALIEQLIVQAVSSGNPVIITAEKPGMEVALSHSPTLRHHITSRIELTHSFSFQEINNYYGRQAQFNGMSNSAIKRLVLKQSWDGVGAANVETSQPVVPLKPARFDKPKG
ncbi:MAG: hypothetical protein PW788_13340 [Micavibrio sp.]|nr:hypothetical protein [Micavibrio sp.]